MLYPVEVIAIILILGGIFSVIIINIIIITFTKDGNITRSDFAMFFLFLS